MLDRFNTMVLDLISRVELRREEGQGTVEYALILAVIVVGVSAALLTMGGAISAKLGAVTGLLNGN